MHESPPEITGHYVMVDGTRIYYDECGSGPTMFCIHTASACSLEWRHFLPEMAKRGFRAIAIDLPGHGKSYPRNWEPIRVMHDYAEFVWKFIKTVCPEEKPIVSGSSIGGSMTLDIACHHSAEMRAALALEAVTHEPDPKQWGNFCNDMENPAWFPGWRNFIEHGGGVTLYDLSGEEYAEFRWQHRYAAQEIGTGDLQAWVHHDVRDKLKDVVCPILVFKGEVDFWVPEEHLDSIVEAVPDGLAEKDIGREMGHYPHFEKPTALAEICTSFLTRRGIV